jgi:hypothetical protein
MKIFPAVDGSARRAESACARRAAEKAMKNGLSSVAAMRFIMG